jgi:hypothetical protein
MRRRLVVVVVIVQLCRTHWTGLVQDSLQAPHRYWSLDVVVKGNGMPRHRVQSVTTEQTIIMPSCFGRSIGRPMLVQQGRPVGTTGQHVLSATVWIHGGHHPVWMDAEARNAVDPARRRLCVSMG